VELSCFFAAFPPWIQIKTMGRGNFFREGIIIRFRRAAHYQRLKGPEKQHQRERIMGIFSGQS
jgi:hypothetical protein